MSDIVKKPWGWENRFAVTDKYLGKVIHVNAGEMLSLQYHRQKDETLLVVKGAMELQLEDDQGQLQTHRLTPGMSRRIVPGLTVNWPIVGCWLPDEPIVTIVDTQPLAKELSPMARARTV